VAASASLTAVVAVSVVVLVSLPGPTRKPVPPAPAPVVTVPPTTAPPPPPPLVPAATTIAEVTGPVPFRAVPNGPAIGSIPVGSWWGTTKFLPVIATAPGWLDVRLPERPNGLTGWIPAAGVHLTSTTYGILVNVATRRVQLYQAGHVVGDFPAGVGTVDDPTPTGHFYVMDVAAPPGPGWGPFVVDTNAHSDAITSWEGSGDAFTAIHGPLGADAEIGTTGGAISHGCVRMHDADLAHLSPVPPGAPVVIIG
jgi:lipoprotein-anchoring transpeptidase ErfK/SrfK